MAKTEFYGSNTSGNLDVSGTVKMDEWGFHIQPASFWRRLWFLISAMPRYLISGSVEVPWERKG